MYDELLSNKYDDISKLYKIAALNKLKYAFLYSKIMDKIIDEKKKVYNKSVGIDIESLFKETAKTIGCANNVEYMIEAFKAIDDV